MFVPTRYSPCQPHPRHQKPYNLQLKNITKLFNVHHLHCCPSGVGHCNFQCGWASLRPAGFPPLACAERATRESALHSVWSVGPVPGPPGCEFQRCHSPPVGMAASYLTSLYLHFPSTKLKILIPILRKIGRIKHPTGIKEVLLCISYFSKPKLDYTLFKIVQGLLIALWAKSLWSPASASTLVTFCFLIISTNIPSPLPRGLCTCCSLCLENFLPPSPLSNPVPASHKLFLLHLPSYF